jgi:hypothetical protein
MKNVSRYCPAQACTYRYADSRAVLKTSGLNYILCIHCVYAVYYVISKQTSSVSTIILDHDKHTVRFNIEAFHFHVVL